MITRIFDTVYNALSGGGIPAFSAAFIWGILSVVLSPCHMGSLPLIIAYVNNRQKPETKTAFGLSLSFGFGLLLTLAAIGVITSAAGRLLGDVGRGIITAVSLFLILCGLWLMDIPPFNRMTFSFQPKTTAAGKTGALVLGLIYGIVLGPCSFAFLAPMVGMVLAASTEKVFHGFLLMICYALGHTAVIIIAGTFGDAVGRFLKKQQSELLFPWFRRICGLAVVCIGVWQFISIIKN